MSEPYIALEEPSPVAEPWMWPKGYPALENPRDILTRYVPAPEPYITLEALTYPLLCPCGEVTIAGNAAGLRELRDKIDAVLAEGERVTQTSRGDNLEVRVTLCEQRGM
jgi:hypothetical protein